MANDKREDTKKFRLWTEDIVPGYAANCDLCELCGQRKRMIWGEGNPKAKIIVILDNPGRREDKEGNSFVCATRQMLQTASYTAGFCENDFYITYILKCSPKKAYDKDMARNACSVYLNKQLYMGSYQIAFCLGDTAVNLFLTIRI